MDRGEYSIERVVSKLYQIYSVLGIMALVSGITTWASIPEEQEERRN